MLAHSLENSLLPWRKAVSLPIALLIIENTELSLRIFVYAFVKNPFFHESFA